MTTTICNNSLLLAIFNLMMERRHVVDTSRKNIVPIRKQC